jgi:hypothetical protein
MKRISRYAALIAICGLASLTGCRSTESMNTDAGSTGMAAQGVGGTGVGAHSTQGQNDAPTGSSTQRAGTGYGGPVSAPGPGQSGR